MIKDNNRLKKYVLPAVLVLALLAVAAAWAESAEDSDAADLQSIQVDTQPAKDIYNKGEALDLTGMVIMAYYTDASPSEVTDYTTSPADGTILDTSGPLFISIIYEEGGVTRTASTLVRVHGDKILEGVYVSVKPDKTEYDQGETLDLAGMVVVVLYTDLSEKVVTDYVTYPAAGDVLDTVGKQIIIITYEEEGFVTDGITDVMVYGDRNLDSIAVTTPPAKTVYVRGEPITFAGMVITATYDDGSTMEITNYTMDYDEDQPLNIIMTYTVTISYTEKDITRTATTEMKVRAYLAAIEVTTPPTKTVYGLGEPLDLAGMVITATYIDLSEVVPAEYTASPADGTILNTIGTHTIEISCEDEGYGYIRYTKFDVTVKAPLDSIAVTTPPTKTEYNAGEPLDLTGMVVTATYTDGSTEEVTDYTTSPEAGTNLNTGGELTITVTYTEGDITKTATTDVTVNLSGDAVFLYVTPGADGTTIVDGQALSVFGRTYEFLYNIGDQVTLRVAADSGYYFEGWQEDLSGSGSQYDLVLTMIEHNYTTGTSFEALTGDEVYLYVTPGANGTTTVDGQVLLDQGTAYMFTYQLGRQVTLTAVADQNFEFKGWQTDLSGKTLQYDLVMDQDYTTGTLFGAPSGGGSGSNLVIEGGNITKTYGDPNFFLTSKGGPAGTVTWTSNHPELVAVDPNTGEVTIKGATNSTVVIITVSKGGAYASIMVTVNKKPVTVTADDKTKRVGEADPLLTYKVSPALLNNDVLVGSLKYTGSEPGKYDIVEEVPFSIDPNYAVTFVKGTMTITGDDEMMWIWIIIPLLIIGGLLLWFLFFRRTYAVVRVGGVQIIGKDKVRRKAAYRFSVEGGAGAVSYRVGENGASKTLLPDADGEYVIPRGEITESVTIESR